MHENGDLVGTRYKIIRLLDRGGFGFAYLAEIVDEPKATECVVKQLEPIFSTPSIWEDAKKRFHTEASVLKNLGFHPQIPQLLDYFEENQQFYLVEEFIDGEDLSKEITKKLFDEAKVIALISDVLEILNFVHRYGTIHRDIKPANLIRRQSDGKFVLIDFGAVKEVTTLFLDAHTKQPLTQPFMTPGYSPPEQQNGKPKFNSDIYALGRTVIATLTGKNPALFEETVTGELKNWEHIISGSPLLINIIKKMLRSSYKERYQNVSDVLRDLNPLIKIGKIVGERYQITSYLSEESCFHTFLALGELPSHSSPYLIRQFPTLIRNEQIWNHIKESFQKEFKILQLLNEHEQIPKVYNYIQEQEELYLVEEFIDGTTLSKEIKATGKLSAINVIDLLKQVLKILNFVHKQNIIHLDIKPANLIRREKDSKIFLVNFAVLKKMVNLISNANKLNDSPLLLGTLGYMPPEQIARKPIFSSDIYALGITVVEALTGIMPEDFPIDYETGKFLWQQFPEIDNKLKKVLDKMITLDRNIRYKDVEQVLNEVEKLDDHNMSEKLREFGKKLIANVNKNN